MAILERKVCDLSDLRELIIGIAERRNLNMAAVGNGTNSKEIQEIVREALPALSVLIVDERDTTLRARERYWESTPRRGWRRLLPSSMQVPPVPVDDFVGVILAERAIKVE